jgi:FtsP/CotA-like multicopper oxidase with cupredoxin domain
MLVAKRCALFSAPPVWRIVPAFGRAAVDLVADQPGLTLFHCHIQMHMDYGFMALFRYA